MTGSETTNQNRETWHRRPVGLDAGTLRRSGVVVALTVALAAVAVATRTSSIVVLWDPSDHSSLTLSTPVAVASILALQIALLGGFAIAPRLQLVEERVAPFREAYQWTALALTTLVFVVFAAIVAWNSGLEFGGGQPFVTRIAALLVAVLLYGSAKALPALPQNQFVGIRSPWTLSDEQVWSQTHERAVPLFKTTALIAALAVAAPSPTIALLVIVVPFLSVLGYLFYYSYRVYEG
ncbi:hypothetical protein GOC74_07070 [Halomicrobium mukohataei]|uniref:DUF1648 domain-containing protein n=1 Tax=Halomicrobium mukohataei TaxID=57705 RepID=A0A847UDW2_9EURY|nr:SdpI family protein [Halomicrobium mukohataei]NLV09690.1 hypothetical protein [Halomicrobium mukohataei]